MPKHAFKFPDEVVEAVRSHVRSAIDALSPKRYRQEANYTAALIARLDGTAYEGQHGSVVFTGTVFDDRGPNSAENRFGADHAITATMVEIPLRKLFLSKQSSEQWRISAHVPMKNSRTK